MSVQNKSIRDIIKEEYVKCAANPVYFMKKYAKIQHPVRGKILFELWNFQEDVLRDFQDNRYNICLKSRQLGISTLIAGYSLWLMLFQTDQNILVIATKQETAKNLVTKVRVMYDNLPSWLKTSVVEDNKLSLRFKNGSQIKAVSAAADAARSEALSLLIIDEAAFIDNIEEIWASAQSTINTGGSAIINSTPNGVGNFYHKQWVNAKTGTSAFNPIFLHWTVHPERDQAWRDQQDIILGPALAAQECDGDFLSSGQSVVDGNTIDWYQKTYICEPREKRGAEGALWIWDDPDPNKTYMICADVARGDGKDYSAFHIMDIENIEQVAEYRGKLDTKSYGNLLVSLATEYNDALLVVENANIGWAVIQQIIDRGYPNLYYTYKEDGYTDPSVHIPKGYDLKDKSQMVPGFSMTSKTRPLVVSKYEMYFRERAPVIKSNRLAEEMFVFVWSGGRAEAQTGYNDDLVMSFAMGLWIRDTALKLRQEGMMRTKMALDYMRKTTSIVSTTNMRSPLKDSGWTMDVGDKKPNEDLTWLL
jgi:hypothetical protein